MPELGEDMYCSQQICIPPTYPYLLRQFAKAAIRSQPNDLLKWATTYFRCLSLNIPPPVKPRLEYPIPRDHQGLTPGWLKALLHQLQPHDSSTVGFRVLWDRWIGACLQHTHLIQILCLGGFTDNTAVPWLRFLALCAAHLTDNLTQSMVLICEILTEEPEGGSAMIPVDVFIDVYRFLAGIDASVPQTLRNYYFLDKFLGLYKEKKRKVEGAVEMVGESEAETVSESSGPSTTVEEKKKRDGDEGSVISCPSVPSEDQDDFMRLLMKVQDGDVEGEDQLGVNMEAIDSTWKIENETKKADEAEAISRSKQGTVDDQETGSKHQDDQPSRSGKIPEDVASKSLRMDDDDDDTESRQFDDDKKKKMGDFDPEKCLQEDLERLKVLHMEMFGESDEEVEKFKASLMEDMMPLTESQVLATEHFKTKSSADPEDVVKKAKEPTTEEIEAEKKDEEEYEDVSVEAVPGIGPIVPEELVQVVCRYMQEMARQQHNMVMPRNIRHFECPPLEVHDV